jgi:hypothetical protein
MNLEVFEGLSEGQKDYLFPQIVNGLVVQGVVLKENEGPQSKYSLKEEEVEDDPLPAFTERITDWGLVLSRDDDGLAMIILNDQEIDFFEGLDSEVAFYVLLSLGLNHTAKPISIDTLAEKVEILMGEQIGAAQLTQIGYRLKEYINDDQSDDVFLIERYPTSRSEGKRVPHLKMKYTTRKDGSSVREFLSSLRIDTPEINSFLVSKLVAR